MPLITNVNIGSVSVGTGLPLAVIAGPCVIESEAHTLKMAEHIKRVCAELGISFVFKASFDKANRSSITSFRGPGLDEGLRILEKTKSCIDAPVLSDVHEPQQVPAAAQVLDVLQIPAFLCRQTDLLVAAARSGKAVNVKKGQFVAPGEMGNVTAKLQSSGCDRILLTERGTFFGYNRLVNDLTSIPQMRNLAPVVFDATHSCQQPGGEGHQSGGNRAFAAVLARAAVAAGADALFMEVHDDPERAMSDPATVLPIDQFRSIVSACIKIRSLVHDLM